MSVPASAIADPIVAPNAKIPFVDAGGKLTVTSILFLQQLYQFVVATSRIFSCNCTNVGNVYSLTLLATAPLLKQYSDYDIFAFVASAGSTGAVTANVTNDSGTFATIKVYKANGASQAGNTDIVSGSAYLAVYVDSLDGGNGGLVLK